MRRAGKIGRKANLDYEIKLNGNAGNPHNKTAMVNFR